MTQSGRSKVTIATLAVLLLASLAANAFLYLWRTPAAHSEWDRPLIERTIANVARTSQTSADAVRSATFPVVMHFGSTTCIELRRRDGHGHDGACYDHSGRVVREVAGVDN